MLLFTVLATPSLPLPLETQPNPSHGWERCYFNFFLFHLLRKEVHLLLGP